MSNPLKAVAKTFKKVIKTVKKVALPALAIGAVVLTGGAALGALAPLSSTIGSLGLSAGLTSALTTAAQGATMGFLGSAVTGGNPLKGAVTGLVTGGILGGANAALGGVTGASGAAGSAANGAVGLTDIPASTVATDFGTAAANADLVAQPVTGMGRAAASSGGGLLGWAERNPMIAGNVIKGIGGGMVAREQAKEEDRRNHEIRDSYEGTGGLWMDSPSASIGGMGQAQVPAAAPIDRFAGKYIFDGKTIKKVQA